MSWWQAVLIGYGAIIVLNAAVILLLAIRYGRDLFSSAPFSRDPANHIGGGP